MMIKTLECTACGKDRAKVEMTLIGMCVDCAKAQWRCVSCGDYMPFRTSDMLCAGENENCIPYEIQRDGMRSAALAGIVISADMRAIWSAVAQ